MRIRSTVIRAAIPAVTLGLIVSGCSSSDSGGTGTSAIGTTNDINPHDVADLRDGGNLRLPISALPVNWNTLSVDGNDIEITNVERPMMPQAFRIDAAGNTSVNTDYFTDVQLTNTNPQQVTYTINPKAAWSDGTPMSWEDIAAEANALSGRDKSYLIANNSGFDRVEKVERGKDDKQAVITFNKHFAEWKGQFAGNSFLLPKSVTGNPEAFNKSQVDGITVTSGPFRVRSTDRAQGRIVLERDPKWWGATPKLDTITFSVLASEATLPALQNNEIDADGIGNRDELKTAQGIPDVAIRRTPATQWSHLTFNGAPGSILSDPAVRVAIIKAIDRQGIATAIDNGLVANPHALNNHVYLEGQAGFQDNSLPYDPDAAAKELDAAGWKLNGDVREKNGRKLEIRDVMYNQDIWVQMAQIMQQNLARVGVKLNIETKPGQGYFSQVIQPGDFDVAQWSWVGDPFPLGSLNQIWGYDPKDIQGNYGRIGSPELNDLIEKTVSELDEKKAIELANQVDKKIWEEGHSAPLIQSPGILAVRAGLANYGARGLATLDWTKVGFLK
ncbi:ABC transporter family substrate-binding protein [Nocardia pseudobrasiliensis]|uniref:Peptide/nickel transport system substrate-binding protein n=1 Tax=Nocardia pseudobrasiliensis TaxID=45979 RepID=A0A370HTQ5_9NOCA|nr:ABC transporter family substrate-binding protein [Nocardia pseudobrasiliensis]RDI61680.1 peptide/nickel transport system substrate-binding protein [Nocardia pseudobrasiliensis]